MKDKYRGYVVEWCAVRTEEGFRPSYAITRDVAGAERFSWTIATVFETGQAAMDQARDIVRAVIDTLLDGDFGDPD